ncbi:hypothetical protein [Propionibacterium sp.]|uniref:hypothetical protein n=1 Tax=Propionibacterium sp. TaxID=1977903 RepID=UPI0039E7B1B8
MFNLRAIFNWKAIEVLDMAVGFIGFFAAAIFVVTVAMELTGRPALGWALALLALVIVLAALLELRHRLLAAEAHGGPQISTRWGGSLRAYHEFHGED